MGNRTLNASPEGYSHASRCNLEPDEWQPTRHAAKQLMRDVSKGKDVSGFAGKPNRQFELKDKACAQCGERIPVASLSFPSCIYRHSRCVVVFGG